MKNQNAYEVLMAVLKNESQFVKDICVLYVDQYKYKEIDQLSS
jgi:hypothetical protein